MTSTQIVARVTRNARGFGERSLEVLRMIEQAVDGLCAVQAVVQALATAGHEIAAELRKMPRQKSIDPEGKWESVLLKARDTSANIQKHFIENREAARLDPKLTEEDGLDDEFSDVIAAVADLHNALNEMAWALGEYESDLQKPTGQTFTDVDQLIAAMEA